jgi:hypothetical protein
MSGRFPELEVELTQEERKHLESVAASRSKPYFSVIRAKSLLMAADRRRNVEIAAVTDQDPRTVSVLRREWRARRLKVLEEKPRAGRPPAFPPRG